MDKVKAYEWFFMGFICGAVVTIVIMLFVFFGPL